MEKCVCECKQNKLQTAQNSHLAVEPAAPAISRLNVLIISNIASRLCTLQVIFCIIQASCQQSHEYGQHRAGLNAKVSGAWSEKFTRVLLLSKCLVLKCCVSNKKNIYISYLMVTRLFPVQISSVCSSMDVSNLAKLHFQKWCKTSFIELDLDFMFVILVVEYQICL